MTLPPAPPLDRMEATRIAWHRLADHVLGALRWRVDQRLGLAAAPGGFGTPRLDDGRQVAVAGRELVVDDGTQRSTHPLTTLGAAAAVLGIPPGAPSGLYEPETDPAPDDVLGIDDDASAVLAAWFALGERALGELAASSGEHDAPSPVTLWPEHFDLALELGDAARDARGTFGASPGDDAHPLPYLYVTHWGPAPAHEFWNDTAFAGASLPFSTLARVDDPGAAAVAFFRTGLAVLAGDTR